MTEYLRRKIRAAIMSGSVKGSLRTASGYPLTLGDCRSIKSLTIHGNDGGVGDKTANLLSMVDGAKGVRGYAVVSGTKVVLNGTSEVAGGRTYFLSEELTLEAGKSYTFAWYYLSGTHTASITANLSQTGVSGEPNYKAAVLTDNANFANPFTVSETVTVKVGINMQVGAEFNNLCGYLAVYEGSYTIDTLPEYEPYGYRIPVMLNGEYKLYSPEMLMQSDTLTVDFEKHTASLSGTDISHLQQWGSVPTGAMVITANTAAAPSEMSVTYYIDTGVV